MLLMMPETCVPTSTSVTGSMVPVAVTLLRMVSGCTSVISNSTGTLFLGHAIMAMIAAMATMATVMITFFFFIWRLLCF